MVKTEELQKVRKGMANKNHNISINTASGHLADLILEMFSDGTITDLISEDERFIRLLNDGKVEEIVESPETTEYETSGLKRHTVLL